MQVAETIDILQQNSKSKDTQIILLGDFNFRDEANERNEQLEAAFLDLWTVHCDTANENLKLSDTEWQDYKLGFTHNIAINLLARAVSSRVSQVTGNNNYQVE